MIELKRPVYRKTVKPYGARPIVVGLMPGDVISVRLLGSRKSFTLPVSHVFDAAVKATIAAERRRSNENAKKG